MILVPFYIVFFGNNNRMTPRPVWGTDTYSFHRLRLFLCLELSPDWFLVLWVEFFADYYFSLCKRAEEAVTRAIRANERLPTSFICPSLIIGPTHAKRHPKSGALTPLVIASFPCLFTMSNDNNSPPPTPSVPSARRASFSPGQKLSELFGRSPTNCSGPPIYPSPIATAAANAQAQQRRRISITSLGLSGSPTQSSTFSQARVRQDSLSSGGSIDENAVDDSEAAPNGSPTSPFARRMSFGAKALRDVKTGTGVGNNGRLSVNLDSSPPAQGRGLSSSHTRTDTYLRNISNYIFRWRLQLVGAIKI